MNPFNSHNFDSDWDYYDWVEGNVVEEDEEPYIGEEED